MKLSFDGLILIYASFLLFPLNDSVINVWSKLLLLITSYELFLKVIVYQFMGLVLGFGSD